jgi:hypothetical protein
LSRGETQNSVGKRSAALAKKRPRNPRSAKVMLTDAGSRDSPFPQGRTREGGAAAPLT